MTKLTCLTHKIYHVVCEIDLLSFMDFCALSFLFLGYHALAYRHTDVPFDLVLIFQEAKNQSIHIWLKYLSILINCG